MKIDFHVHTAERSACATAMAAEQIKKAIASGLDAIAITDHHQLVHPRELERYNQNFAPFQILPGIEITSDREDWLVLGLHDPLLESDTWYYPDLHRFVRSKGGFIVLAHPYRYRPTISVDLFANPPDAIEIRSNNIRSEHVARIQELADKLKVTTLCNSDGHYTGHIGNYYNILPLQQPTTCDQILETLRVRSPQHSLQ
jgi:predicted metal-dependent phosphoesterase TrpH